MQPLGQLSHSHHRSDLLSSFDVFVALLFGVEAPLVPSNERARVRVKDQEQDLGLDLFIETGFYLVIMRPVSQIFESGIELG